MEKRNKNSTSGSGRIKRIIYITNVRLPTYRAHGLQVMKSCEAFARSGASVYLIAPRLKPHIEEDPFLYYNIKDRFVLKKSFVWEVLPYFKIFPRLGSYIQGISFSLPAVLSVLGKKRQGSIFYSRDYITLLFLALFGFKPVAEIHDYRLSKASQLFKFILRCCGALILNSEGTKKLIEAHYDIQDKHILVAPNGVDVSEFDLGVSRTKIRQELKLPQGKIIFAYIGQLEVAGKEKGVSLLLKAYSLLGENFRDKSALLVVGGLDDAVDKYQEIAREFEIDSDLLAFTGNVEYKESIKYYNAVDVVVIPLEKGKHAITTSPIKVFCSLAAGKVIIAPKIPSLMEFLNNKNAVLVEPNSAESIKEAMEDFIRNPEKFARMAENAEKSAAKYSWNSRAQEILSFLNKHIEQ